MIPALSWTAIAAKLSWGAALVAALVLTHVGSYVLGSHRNNIEWERKVAIKKSEAKLRTDVLKQDITTLREKKNEQIRAVESQLATVLERLRERSSVRMSEATAANCQGATGAELSKPDAGFLAREAARADRLQAALAECYATEDRLRQLTPRN